MKHFIVTRFNLKVEQWKTSKDGSPVLTMEWLKHRFQLFETFCLPSVINQQNQNFHWLIFFDTDTPTEFKERISELTNPYPNIEPLFIDGIVAFHPAMQTAIRSNLELSDTHVITTRLDNDDAIHQNFTDKIQQLAKGEKEAVIDLSYGYQLQEDGPSYICRKYHSPFNPFVSYVEPTEGIKTVYVRMHSDWMNHENIKSCSEEPLWLVVIHQLNKANEVNKGLKLTNTFDPSAFGLSLTIQKTSGVYIAWHNFLVELKKQNKK